MPEPVRTVCYTAKRKESCLSVDLKTKRLPWVILGGPMKISDSLKVEYKTCGFQSYR